LLPLRVLVLGRLAFQGSRDGIGALRELRRLLAAFTVTTRTMSGVRSWGVFERSSRKPQHRPTRIDEKQQAQQTGYTEPRDGVSVAGRT
jgi:hypothetical protein